MQASEIIYNLSSNYSTDWCNKDITCLFYERLCQFNAVLWHYYAYGRAPLRWIWHGIAVEQIIKVLHQNGYQLHIRNFVKQAKIRLPVNFQLFMIQACRGFVWLGCMFEQLNSRDIGYLLCLNMNVSSYSFYYVFKLWGLNLFLYRAIW